MCASELGLADRHSLQLLQQVYWSSDAVQTSGLGRRKHVWGTSSSSRPPRTAAADSFRPAPQAWSPTTPNAAYEINIQTKPSSSIQLNALRGRVFLPHSAFSSTKRSFILVFATGAQARAALAAGADRVGGEELVAEILSGDLSPDKLITTPELLSLFTRNPALARFLGPKGLMPSAKRGTVADDLVTAVKEARGGLDWKGDSRGVVRAGEPCPAISCRSGIDSVMVFLLQQSDE